MAMPVSGLSVVNKPVPMAIAVQNRTFANSVTQNARPVVWQSVQAQKRRLPTIFDFAA
jgi:hypothetical protein